MGILILVPVSQRWSTVTSTAGLSEARNECKHRAESVWTNRAASVRRLFFCLAICPPIISLTGSQHQITFSFSCPPCPESIATVSWWDRVMCSVSHQLTPVGFYPPVATVPLAHEPSSIHPRSRGSPHQGKPQVLTKINYRYFSRIIGYHKLSQIA